MIVTCHDATGFINFACWSCGQVLHLHLTQALLFRDGSDGSAPFTRCRGCGLSLLLPGREGVVALIRHTVDTGDVSPFPLLPFPMDSAPVV